MLQEAFSRADSPALPARMLQGCTTLLNKGKGADRALPSTYEPINTDYKLAAHAVTRRMGPLHTGGVDATQTSFLPDRSIGDNVLAHLEEIAYLEETQQPGVLLCLDFEKPFDHLDSAQSAVGFIRACSGGCASCTQAHLPGLP